MNTEKRKRLRELEAKATPGPWESMDGPNVGIIKDATGRAVAMTIWMLRDFPGIAVPDAAFIAAARTAVPALLDALEESDRHYETAARQRHDYAARLEVAGKTWQRMLKSDCRGMGNPVAKVEAMREIQDILNGRGSVRSELQAENAALRERVAVLEKVREAAGEFISSFDTEIPEDADSEQVNKLVDEYTHAAAALRAAIDKAGETGKGGA